MPYLTEDMNYELSSTERLKELKHLLHQDLNDLKNEIEENEMVHGIIRPVRYFIFACIILGLQIHCLYL